MLYDLAWTDFAILTLSGALFGLIVVSIMLWIARNHRP